MSKSIFLTDFQVNLRNEIEKLLVEEWKLSYLSIEDEACALNGQFTGFIDICISHSQNPNSIVAIEIEHKADSYYPQENIEKLKKWCHNSPYRKCGMLHIFNAASNIRLNKYESFVLAAKEYEHRNRGFYYEYLFYDVFDGRAKKQLALDIVSSLDFRIRLKALLSEVNII